MENCGVYEIVNLVNNHRYVGSSKDVLARLTCHKRELGLGKHQNKYLQNAWSLYGSNNFRFLFLQQCDPKERLGLEQKWIDETYPEYNLVLKAGGGSYPGVNKGSKHPGRGLGKKRPDNILRNKTMRTKGHTGILHSNEAKTKMSLAWIERRKQGISEETRAKLRIANQNKTISPEARAKISATLKGHIVTVEMREKSAVKQRGVKLSPERIQLSIEGRKRAKEKRDDEAAGHGGV